MLNEIAHQGGWAQAVWGLIDHISAGPSHTPPAFDSGRHPIHVRVQRHRLTPAGPAGSVVVGG